jgi:hypothetical protein
MSNDRLAARIGAYYAGTADRADLRCLRTHAPYNLSGHLRPNSPPIMPPIKPPGPPPPPPR